MRKLSEGVGIEIEKSGLRIAVIVDGHVKMLTRRDITPERTQWHILRETRREFGERVVFCVPAPGLFGRLIKCNDEEELPYRVRFLLPDEPYLFKLSYTSFGNEYFFAGVYREEITGYFNLIRRAGFDPIALDISLFSSLNALFHNYPEERAKDFFLFHIGEEVGYLTFVRGIKPILATGFERKNWEKELLIKILAELQEIVVEGKFDFFLSGTIGDGTIADEIGSELEVDVEILNPLKRFTVEEEVEEPALFSGALGAALRARKYVGT